MTQKRKARMLVSTELIEDALQFDSHTKIVGSQWDWKTGTIELFVDGPQFREVQEGHGIPRVNPVVTADENGKLTHDWGVSDDNKSCAADSGPVTHMAVVGPHGTVVAQRCRGGDISVSIPSSVGPARYTDLIPMEKEEYFAFCDALQQFKEMFEGE
jgi:hypothetical protein